MRSPHSPTGLTTSSWSTWPVDRDDSPPRPTQAEVASLQLVEPLRATDPSRPDPVAADELFGLVQAARRAGDDRLMVEEPVDVRFELRGGAVAPRPVLLQRLHHDPVEVAADLPQEGRRFRPPVLGLGRRGLAHGAQLGARPGRVLLADLAADLVEAGPPEVFRVEGQGPQEGDLGVPGHHLAAALPLGRSFTPRAASRPGRAPRNPKAGLRTSPDAPAPVRARRRRGCTRCRCLRRWRSARRRCRPAARRT